MAEGTQFTAPSGAAVIINVASWEAAKALKKAIAHELSVSKIPIDFTQDITALASSVLALESSDAVDAALFDCLARCTRNGQKITPMTFDDAEARRDYYPIVTACVKENLSPLVESLFSLLSEIGIMQKAQQQAEAKKDSQA